jgi:hypothetical protein
MSKRLAVLAATTALVGLSHPAMAQQGWVDGSYDAVAETAMRGGHSWSDEPQAGVSWGAEGAAAGAAKRSARAVHRWRIIPPQSAAPA